MVVVQKINCQVPVCVDLTKLNKSACRERNMLPSVEKILAQLDGDKVFSKLDVAACQSQFIDHFITPFYFNRLPCVITSAPGSFQKCTCMYVIYSCRVASLYSLNNNFPQGLHRAEHCTLCA